MGNGAMPPQYARSRQSPVPFPTGRGGAPQFERAPAPINRNSGFTLAYTEFLPRDALLCKARSCDRTSSVRLFVCNVGGSGARGLEILQTKCTNNYPNTFALRSPKATHLLPGEHGGIWGRLEVGWEKWRSEAQKRQ